MSQNYQSDRLGQALDKIKINHEQRIYEHSHDGEKHIAKIFRYVVENVLWEVLTQRKKELERKKYIVNISRRFPDCSDPACFVKMELWPAPAFCTGDAPNEDKSMPVYEWLARPNARAGLIEILHHPHAVQREGGACCVVRTLRDWWYTDRISVDQLTIEYVESSIDKWIVSSIRHYVRQKPQRSGLNSFQRRRRINSGKSIFLPKFILYLTFSSMILYVGFLGWKIGRFWYLLGFPIFFVIVLFILARITEEHKYILGFKLWFKKIP